MSNENDSNDLEDLSNKAEKIIDETAETVSEAMDSISEKVEDVVETVSEKAEDIMETVTETFDDVVEDASEVAGGFVSKVMAFKQSNPKVFFGGIGALVLVILFLMMSGGGGSKKQLSSVKMGNLAVGQTYSLRAVNSYDPNSTVRLVSVPGSLAAYDDTEEDDRVGDCKHIPQGTKVKVVRVQNAMGNTTSVQIEMLEGECAGSKGWTISTNLN